MPIKALRDPNASTTGLFDELWQLDLRWFEPPNYSRGGWSGVARQKLSIAGKELNVFIKRQDRHLTRTWNHWLSGIPTFQKEYANIQRLLALDIPTLEPLYYGKQGKKAILVTKALDDYQSLDKLKPGELTSQQRSALLKSLANTVRTLHDHRLQHNCLYPKHLFARETTQNWDVRLIDLEKLRWQPWRRRMVLRDLSSLVRHASRNWTTTDRLRFFKAYVDESRLSASSKKLWRQIAAKAASKRR